MSCSSLCPSSKPGLLSLSWLLAYLSVLRSIQRC
jgi:hypothetical protein